MTVYWNKKDSNLKTRFYACILDSLKSGHLKFSFILVVATIFCCIIPQGFHNFWQVNNLF